MRGIRREEQEIVIDLLKQGIPSSVIVKQLGIPRSTVSDWRIALNKSLNKSERKLERSNIIDGYIRDTEAHISAAVSRIVNPDIADNEWFAIEKLISTELNNLINKTIEDLNS